MKTDEIIAFERSDLKRQGLDVANSLKKSIPLLEECLIKSGRFPIWVIDVQADVRILMLLAAQDAILAKVQNEKKQEHDLAVTERRRKKNR